MSGDKLQTVRFSLNEILSEAPKPPSSFDDEPEPAPIANQPQPKAQPIVRPAAPPTNTGMAAVTAKEAKSLLADLGLDTAIRPPLGDARYQRQANDMVARERKRLSRAYRILA
jgi:hypothetical protein